MIAHSVLDAISNDGLRQSARQILTGGTYSTSLSLRAKTRARSDLIAGLASIAATDGREVAAALMAALYPHLTAAIRDAELDQILSAGQYFRSRNNAIHNADCPHRPATVWRYAAGKSEAEVTELLRSYPWLHWCRYCGPRQAVAG